MNGPPPLDPCVVLTTADYDTPMDLCNAQKALYNEGYTFSYTATKGSDTWICFVGTWQAE